MLSSQKGQTILHYGTNHRTTFGNSDTIHPDVTIVTFGRAASTERHSPQRASSQLLESMLGVQIYSDLIELFTNNSL